MHIFKRKMHAAENVCICPLLVASTFRSNAGSHYPATHFHNESNSIPADAIFALPMREARLSKSRKRGYLSGPASGPGSSSAKKLTSKSLVLACFPLSISAIIKTTCTSSAHNVHIICKIQGQTDFSLTLQALDPHVLYQCHSHANTARIHGSMSDSLGVPYLALLPLPSLRDSYALEKHSPAPNFHAKCHLLGLSVFWKAYSK